MKTINLSDRTNMFYWQTNRNIDAQTTKKIFLDRSKALDKKQVKQAIRYGMKKAGRNNIQVTKLGNLISDGSVNNVLKAKLSDTTEVIIRMHPPGVKNGYFHAESVASQKAKEQGVPTYKTYTVVDDQKKFNFDFMIMESLPGETMRNFTQSGEIKYKYEEELIHETGKYAALIHKVNPKGFGFFDNQIAKKEKKLQGQYDSFDKHIFAALEEDLTFLQKSDSITKKQQKTMYTLFEKNIDLMDCKQAVLIHNDIADWNQLSDGEHVTGMIDWDECHAGDPVMEFAAYSLFFGEPRMTWFKQGYQEVSPLPDNFDEKFQLFKLRYLISKLHLRVKRKTVDNSEGIRRNIKRGFEAMEEIFDYFKI